MSGTFPAAKAPLGHGSHTLLVDSLEFLDAIEPAMADARDRVLVQTMTFEMDRVGARLWDAMARSPAAEKILCVDAFSTIKISDRFAFGPSFWAERGFRREVRRTRSMVRSRQSEGVRVVVTNPLGALWHRYPLRNHKKMVIADDAAFLGGVNFSEHNFRWRDLMLRATDPALVEALAQDFRLTVGGTNQAAVRELDNCRLYLLDGHNSRTAYHSLLDEITEARRSIDIISPYASNPLLSRLRRLSSRLSVRVIVPALNNKPLATRALVQAAAETDMEVLLYQPAMSHIKAALIDGERLVLGSYNFDFVGYELQQEVAISIADVALAKDFTERVLEPALSQCSPAPQRPRGRLNWAGWAMGIAEQYIKMLRRLIYR